MNADQSRLAEAGGEGSAPCGAAEAALKGERKRGGAHALPCSHVHSRAHILRTHALECTRARRTGPRGWLVEGGLADGVEPVSVKNSPRLS